MRFNVYLILIVLAGAFSHVNCIDKHEDKLERFYERLMKPDVKKCDDNTLLMPDCTVCIPGLQKSNGSENCNSYVKESINIRSEIGRLTSERYGAAVLTSSRPFGLYPCKSYCVLKSLAESKSHPSFSWSKC